MSNLSELLPSGGGQNAVDFVASGTLSSGQTVALKADGTVEAVAEISNSISSLSTVSSSILYYTNSIDIGGNKIVLIYRNPNDSYKSFAVVGSISGTTVTYGTPVQFGGTAYPAWLVKGAYDANADKVVITYEDAETNRYATAIVGTVSGTSISFGTPVIYDSSQDCETSIVEYHPASTKNVFLYGSDTGSFYGIVGTVSGTSISFGTKTSVPSSGSYRRAMFSAYDTNTAQVIFTFAARTSTSYHYPFAITAAVSGTSVSFGTPAYISGNRTSQYTAGAQAAVSYDPINNCLVFGYRKDVDGNATVIVKGTVSGTTISIGTGTTISSGAASSPSMVYSSQAKKSVFHFSDPSNSYYSTYTSIDGSDMSYSTFYVVSAGATQIGYTSSINKSVATRWDGVTPLYSTLFYTPTYSNSADFIGITASAIADTATGSVNTFGGINEAQSGLTIAADYYVQDDGTLSTTASSVKVGQAISATTINMMDLT